MPLIRKFDKICDTGIAIAGFTSGLCGEWNKEHFSDFAKETGIAISNMTVANQHHTDLIHIAGVEDAGLGTIRPFGEDCYDALTTDRTGLMLCVHTADCVPIVILEPIKKAAAAIHSGWVGSSKNIAGKTVRKMKDNYGCDPSNIICCIGPYNHSCCYEVGDDVLDSFRSSFSEDECAQMFRKKENHNKYLLDLGMGVTVSLCQEGVCKDNIHDSGYCTYHTDEFSSWRRTGNKKHQILTYIMIKAV